MKKTKTLHERRTDAVENRKYKGLRIDNAYSDRHIAVMQDYGIVDEEGRLPRTRTPERSHHNSRKGRISKKAAGIALAFTATLGAAYGIGRSVDDTTKAPNPGNMESFSNDPLQSDYRENPEGFMVVGSEIQPIPQSETEEGNK